MSAGRWRSLAILMILLPSISCGGSSADATFNSNGTDSAAGLARASLRIEGMT